MCKTSKKSHAHLPVKETFLLIFITYEVVMNDRGFFGKVQMEYIIVDEVRQVFNVSTRT